jgi:hypothetical protein
MYRLQKMQRRNIAEVGLEQYSPLFVAAALFRQVVESSSLEKATASA